MGIDVGTNWYWNRYLRWQFNAGYASISGGLHPETCTSCRRLQMAF
jgi:hypothetical protein